MSYIRVKVRLCLDGKLEEKQFDDVKDVYHEHGDQLIRVTNADGKTTAWFNKDYVYEVITEEMK